MQARHWILGGVLLATAALGLAFVLRQPTEGASPANPPTPQASPLPHFADPAEATRYRDAVMAGDTRMIASLDDALTQARARPDTSPDYVQRLERLRAERLTRLESYRHATPADAAP